MIYTISQPDIIDLPPVPVVEKKPITTTTATTTTKKYNKSTKQKSRTSSHSNKESIQPTHIPMSEEDTETEEKTLHTSNTSDIKEKTSTNSNSVPELISDDEMPDLIADNSSSSLDEEEDEEEDDFEENVSNTTTTTTTKDPSREDIDSMSAFYQISALTPVYTELSRLKRCKTYYHVLNVSKDSSPKEIQEHFDAINRLLFSSPKDSSRVLIGYLYSNTKVEYENLVNNAKQLVYEAYHTLYHEKNKLNYDLLLLKGEGTIDTKGLSLLKYSSPTLRLYSVFIFIILFFFKLLNICYSSLYNLVSFKPKKQMKWCSNCEQYHMITNDDNTLWEEDGKYFYRRDGKIHDVTNLIKSGILANSDQDKDSKDQEEVPSPPLHSPNNMRLPPAYAKLQRKKIPRTKRR